MLGLICLFYVCLLGFVCLVICFVCLFDSFVWLFAFDYFLFDNICRLGEALYKSMQSMSHDWETVKTVAHETVRHMT